MNRRNHTCVFIIHFVFVEENEMISTLDLSWNHLRGHGAVGIAKGIEVIICYYWLLLFEFEFLVFNATFSNISAISWRPVLVVEEARVPGENHRLWASNW